MVVYLNFFNKCCVCLFYFNLDIDECISGFNVCLMVLICINIDGLYYCKCNEGYFQFNFYLCLGNFLVICLENVIFFFFGILFGMSLYIIYLLLLDFIFYDFVIKFIFLFIQ